MAFSLLLFPYLSPSCHLYLSITLSFSLSLSFFLFRPLSLSVSLPRVPLDLSPVHGHNQHRNAGIARRAATFPAGTTRWGDVPGCCWQVECSTSPQRTHELLVRRDVLQREKETRRWWCVCPDGWRGPKKRRLGGGYTEREEGPRDSDESDV